MDDFGKRLIGYGSTAVVVGGLVWAGFAYRAEPDVLTLLSSAEVQLRLAAGMPERDAAGRELTSRRDLIESARGELERAERIEPGLVEIREYRGFLAYLDGRYLEAARIYGELWPALAGESRDHALINQLRMLRMAGRDAEAVGLLERHGGELTPANAAAVRAEMAAAVAAAGGGGSADSPTGAAPR